MQFLGIWNSAPFACDGSHQHCADEDHHGNMRVLTESEVSRMVDMADTDQYDGGPHHLMVLENGSLVDVTIGPRKGISNTEETHIIYHAYSDIISNASGEVVGAIDWTDH